MPSKRSGLLHVETDATAPEAGVAICSLVGKANARLIAAAPAMLAALYDAKEALYNPFEPDNQSRAYKEVCAAIEKATNE